MLCGVFTWARSDMVSKVSFERVSVSNLGGEARVGTGFSACPAAAAAARTPCRGTLHYDTKRARAQRQLRQLQVQCAPPPGHAYML